MKVDQWVRFIIRYGFILFSLFEWSQLPGMSAHQIVFFTAFIAVVQIGYYWLKYQWYILVEGIAVALLCFYFQTVFAGLILLLCFEISLRFSFKNAVVMQVLLGLIIIIPAMQQFDTLKAIMTVFFILFFLYGNYILEERRALQEELDEVYQKLSEQRYDLQQAQYKMGTMKEIFTLQERNRISREIHDSVGHSLSTIIIQLGAISQLAKMENSPIQEMSEGLREFATQGLQEVRKIVHDLKPEQMDRKQLDIALEEFFHEVQVNSGLEIQFRKNDPTFALNSEAELSVFRGVQEAITNAMRHGNATKITVLLMYNQAQLVVTIKDNGQGATSKELVPKGGLKSLQERLRREGGIVEMNSSNQGVTIQFIIPNPNKG
jgi:histidine kinase-related ATPase